MSHVVGGRYRLVEPLGGGGTSLVYRATVEGGGPDVALKQLRPQLATDPALRRRFLAEAELARGLDHPGIVRLLDAGEDGGVPFLVMELVRAATLRQRLERNGKLPLSAAGTVLVLLARALDHAHRHGVIHRDVKPQNIFVDQQGVKLGDFGNARVVSLASVTGASLTWGTPEYVAPEVFMRGRADPRSDLYALGVVLFEMLTGRQPWSRAEVLTRLAGGGGAAPPPPPTGAGPAIDRLVADMLAFSPVDRPASAEEVVARLQEEEAPVAVARIACPACGARRAPDIPRCLSCGKQVLQPRHDPGGPWRLVLDRLEDDAEATGRLLRVLDPLAEPVSGPIQFLLGRAALYSDEELKTGISLPAVLFSDLDEGTARALEAIFREHDVSVRAVKGATTTSPAKAAGIWTVKSNRFALTMGLGAAFLYDIARGHALLEVLAVAVAVGGGIKALIVAYERVSSRRRAGVFRLREQLAAAPVAERLLAAAAEAGPQVRAPEVRALFADLAAELYRLTRRAGEVGGRAGAASSEADLLQRTAAAAPALGERLRRIAAHLDALDGVLDGPSEGELMQSLARLERAATGPGADRDAIAAARRDLEATLDRRHAAEQDRARLSAALCGLLGRLRVLYRQVSAMETLDEQEARALEAASEELEVFLARR